MGSTITHDWAILDMPNVQDVAEQAARRLARQYDSAIEYEDALQEAYLLLATKPSLIQVADEPGLLFYRLLMDLTDLVRPEARHRTMHTSWERLVEGVCE